ncbi:hypothetical protein [Armatimonas sp.]|uniref:hypothetical protein n=1 Tax=Armatimonas sp. TaxID=1872638 RepID=UPI00286A6D5A|nr:hypothetical protein [Armatimonas sp.]
MKNIILILLVTSFLLATTPAFAQTPAPSMALRAAEAFNNLSAGLAYNEKVFAEGRPGFRLALDTSATPLTGIVLAP